MKQITEDYVSYETAVLLKEKKFGWKCNTAYLELEDGRVELRCEDKAFYQEQTKRRYCVPALLAPSLYNAMKWLREVHKLHIYAKPYWPQGDMRNKMSWQGFIVNLNTINGDSQCYADSYEEAIENRIKFALENLI